MQIKNQQPNKIINASALCAGILVLSCLSFSAHANTITQQIQQQQQTITQQQKHQNTLENDLKHQEIALANHQRTMNTLVKEQKNRQKRINKLKQQQIELKHQELQQQTQ